MSILAGFEAPSGKRVEIPDEGHMGIFGQTQLSGKTTTIEAITFRGGFKAVAFITKRGESSFLTGRIVPPYFSEPTNDPEQPLWRWVQSILEASQKRTLRFEESWIIRACEDPRQAKTLADVHANIQALISGERKTIYTGKRKGPKMELKWLRKPVTGMNAGVYTSLNAYFNIVMPQLSRLPYTKKLVLGPGLSVMDLRAYSIEMQSLVIRSVMEHVYLHERNTRVIVPEAQDFVPQGKNSPVKMACENMVRKGAALKNFMWLDSQDMAAVDKVMLRAVSILFCGVQGEAHEINRAIEHMLGRGLTSHDIATLPIGHFYVRLPGGEVKKVYVQPAWMDSEVHARAIAMGEVRADSAKAMLAAFKAERKDDAEKEEESYPRSDGNTEKELTGGGDGRNDGKAAGGSDRGRESAGESENRDLDLSHRGADKFDDSGIRRSSESSNGIGDSGRTDHDLALEEMMWKEKFETLQAQFDELTANYRKLEQSHDLMAREKMDGKRASAAGGRSASGAAPGETAGEAGAAPSAAPAHSNGHMVSLASLESAYDYIVKRAGKDMPSLLRLLVDKPELRVEVKRQTIEAEGDSLRGQLARLIAEKFMDRPRPFGDIRSEMVRRGFIDKKLGNVHVGKAIAGLVELGFLTNEESGYQSVPDMKIHIHEA